MSRTTAGAVKAVLLQDYDAKRQPDLTPYIDTASALVDRVAAAAVPPTELTLELIERWLAAHCYCQSDQPYAARSTMSASGTFQGETGLALDNTKYGQTAKLLDSTGTLAAISSGSTGDGAVPTASMMWVGTEYR